MTEGLFVAVAVAGGEPCSTLLWPVLASSAQLRMSASSMGLGRRRYGSKGSGVEAGWLVCTLIGWAMRNLAAMCATHMA